MAIMVDPWRMHLKGYLSLVSDSQYEASIRRLPTDGLLGDSFLATNPTKDGGIKRVFGRSTKRASVPNYSNGSLCSLYKYEPLKGPRFIRLLELSSGKPGEPLLGTLKPVDMNSRPQYVAMSYVWGASFKPHHLTTPEGNIPVTFSLYSALQAIRDQDKPIVLWADAICIDQSNSHEKSIQIRLMRPIYESAEYVLGWIGEEKHNSHNAIEILLQIRTQAANPMFWPSDLASIPPSWSGKKIPDFEDTIWADIDAFLQREWFRRAWIIQEVVLGTKVKLLCGKWNIDLDDLGEALKLTTEAIDQKCRGTTGLRSPLHATDPAQALSMIRQTYYKGLLGRKQDLLSLLELSAHSKATRERDKLFALLGLASDTNGEAFDPDYDSSMETVVLRYAREFVRKGRAMDLIYRAGTSKAYSFSSWIPKWTGEAFPRTISDWRGALGTFCAGGSNPPRVQVSSSMSEVLEISGFAVDTITKIGSVSTLEKDLITFVNSVRQMAKELQSYPEYETLDEVMLKLPIGDAGRPYSEPHDDILVPHRAMTADYWCWLGPTFNITKSVANVNSIREMMDFLRKPKTTRDSGWMYWETAAAFAGRIPNARVCMTEKGYLGLVCGDVQVGDRVGVFQGGAVPFTLRPSNQDKAVNTWTLVGECYIHGIMYGEALSWPGIVEQEFCLI
jgi:hypothetical protein